MKTFGTYLTPALLTIVWGGSSLVGAQSLDITAASAVTVSVSGPNCATLPFTGTAKQTIKLTTSQAVSTARIWSLALSNPDGSVLASLSVEGSDAALDRVRLLQDGTYQLRACPSGTGTAEMTLKVSRAVVGTFEIRLNMADDPISVGTDVASTHYRVRRLRTGQSGMIQSVSAEARTAPDGSDAEFAIKVSSDGGSTWNNAGSVVLPAGQQRVDVDASALTTTTLNQNDLIRYDIIRVGSTTPGGGIALTLSVGVVE